MTRDQLKAKLVPIVTDETLTKSQRQEKFLPFMKQMMKDNPGWTFDDFSEYWNNIMVEIVNEHNLRRH